MTLTTLIRAPKVGDLRGYGRSQVYADVARGILPPPIRRSRKMSVWPAFEIEAVNRAEISGASEEEIKALVKQLVEQRKHVRESGGATT